MYDKHRCPRYYFSGGEDRGAFFRLERQGDGSGTFLAGPGVHSQGADGSYDDHVRDLERLDYPIELAQQRALLAMGDPEEIGRRLNRVHKPWLGWLWMASRIAVVLCLALLLVYGTGYWRNVADDLQPLEKTEEYEPYGFQFDPAPSWTREAVTAGGSVNRCGYDISIPYAALWCHEDDGPYYAASVLITDRPFCNYQPRMIGRGSTPAPRNTLIIRSKSAAPSGMATYGSISRIKPHFTNPIG